MIWSYRVRPYHIIMIWSYHEILVSYHYDIVIPYHYEMIVSSQVDIIGSSHTRFEHAKPSLVERPSVSGADASATNSGAGGTTTVASTALRTVSDSLGPDLTPDILKLLKDQFSSLYPSTSAWVNYHAHVESPPSVGPEWSTSLEMRGQCFMSVISVYIWNFKTLCDLALNIFLIEHRKIGF